MTLKEIQRQAIRGIPQIAEQWLAPIGERLRDAIAVAESGTLSDAQFAAYISALYEESPKLLDRIDVMTLADSLADVQAEAMLTELERGTNAR